MHKKANRLLAIGLISVLSFTTISTTVHAIGNSNGTTLEFQSENIEDSLKLLDNIEFDSVDPDNPNIGYVEEENYKSIVNTETGDITHIFYSDSGEISEQYTTNFYENIKNLDSQFQENQADTPSPQNKVTTYATTGIIASNSTMGVTDALYYAVNRTTRDYIQIKNSSGKTHNYSKALGTYYSGNTKSFMNSVDNADKYISNLYGSIGGTAVVAIVGYFGLIGGPLTSTAVKAGLTALGLGSLFSLVTSITNNFNDYRYWVKQADHYYNNI